MLTGGLCHIGGARRASWGAGVTGRVMGGHSSIHSCLETDIVQKLSFGGYTAYVGQRVSRVKKGATRGVP